MYIRICECVCVWRCQLKTMMDSMKYSKSLTVNEWLNCATSNGNKLQLITEWEEQKKWRNERFGDDKRRCTAWPTNFDYIGICVRTLRSHIASLSQRNVHMTNNLQSRNAASKNAAIRFAVLYPKTHNNYHSRITFIPNFPRMKFYTFCILWCSAY